jgi:hypothetical protein
VQRPVSENPSPRAAWAALAVLKLRHRGAEHQIER